MEEDFKIRVAKVRIGDPKLAYRKEVEKLASRGVISSLGRRILDDLRDNLAVNPEDANAVEEEILQAYREYQRKLQRYDQAFAEAIELESPISEATREELSRYQELLGLREEDILPIERKYQAQERVKLQSHLTDTVHSDKKFRKLVLLGILGAIISFLSFFSSPFFLDHQSLNQKTKAKQAEAKAHIGPMNRAQQAFFIEQGQFASDISSLGLGINPKTTYYSYKTQAYNSGESRYAISTATPKQDGIKSYVGGVFIITTASNKATTVAILCESTEPSASPPSPPTLVKGAPRCSPGSRDLAK